MPSLAVSIARKEILDHLRDVRSLISSAFYILMGPSVVALVSIAVQKSDRPASNPAFLLKMAVVFTLVSTFVGGMNLAMDTIAGERERRSLLPLLINPVHRFEVAAGKWLAISVFGVAGVILNLLGFALALALSNIPSPIAETSKLLILVVLLGLIPLALLAAALELLVSTFCRSIKEAHTYLSLLIFVPMIMGMFLAFFPQVSRGAWFLVPIVGQHLLLELNTRGEATSVMWPAGLGLVTLTATGLALLGTTSRLRQGEIICGNQ
ncbi:MAG: ABC transporter permease subunit [Acidobacteria bacterium]|nr:ABC transporter permease subunit [Acidobacteriota bacterium]